MSLPDKPSKSLVLFDPNVYTINRNSGVRDNYTGVRKKEIMFPLNHAIYLKDCSGRKIEINN